MPFVPKTETTNDLPFTPSAKPIEEMDNDKLTKEIEQLYKNMDTYMTSKANKTPTSSQHQPPQEEAGIHIQRHAALCPGAGTRRLAGAGRHRRESLPVQQPVLALY